MTFTSTIIHFDFNHSVERKHEYNIFLFTCRMHPIAISSDRKQKEMIPIMNTALNNVYSNVTI